MLLDRTTQSLRESGIASSAHPAPESVQFCGASQALYRDRRSELLVPAAAQRLSQPMSLFGVPSPHRAS